MDNLNRYRHIIRELIQRYAQHQPACGEVQIEVILDETNDHYELMYAGWNGPYRMHDRCCTLTSARNKCGCSTMGQKTAWLKSVLKRVFPAIVLCSPSSHRTSVPIQILLGRELRRHALHQCSCHVSWRAIFSPLTRPPTVSSRHPWRVLPSPDLRRISSPSGGNDALPS